MTERKKQKVIIDVYFDEGQNHYYKVTDEYGDVPSNCDSGVFLDEDYLDSYTDDWDIVKDYRSEGDWIQ
jgi:hypothetical protein